VVHGFQPIFVTNSSVCKCQTSFPGDVSVLDILHNSNYEPSSHSQIKDILVFARFALQKTGFGRHS
jgi:hypothetical protein